MKKVCSILFIGVLLSACSKNDMDRTIFIPDKNDSNLPAYTEWGYNSFGAKYERDYFLSSDAFVPCKIVYKDGQLQFLLQGEIKNNWKKMTLTFIFPSEPLQNYNDLAKLNNRKINLADDDCTVIITRDSSETILNVSGGELHFKRAQLLSIDEEMNRVILSGVFDVQFLQDNLPFSFSNGRFDVGITKDVFAVVK